MLICIVGGWRGALHSPSKVQHMILNNIYGDTMQNKFYLPGDIKKCMPGYYAYKFDSDMKKVRDLVNNNQFVFEKMATKFNEMGLAMRSGLLAGMVSSGIRELMIRNEERRDQMDAFQYAMGMLADVGKPSELEELGALLKKPMDYESLMVKPKSLPRPTKCVKASRVNRKVNKTIYHHVRSNC